MAYFTENTRTHPIAAAKRLSVMRVLAQMMATARQRRNLADLDDHLLEDIGVSRKDAAQEAAKSPWNAPRSWRL